MQRLIWMALMTSNLWVLLLLTKLTQMYKLQLVTQTLMKMVLDDVNQYYANASYAFSDNVNTYFEIGGNDDDDTELGYVAGMAISF